MNKAVGLFFLVVLRTFLLTALFVTLVYFLSGCGPQLVRVPDPQAAPLTYCSRVTLFRVDSAYTEIEGKHIERASAAWERATGRRQCFVRVPGAAKSDLVWTHVESRYAMLWLHPQGHSVLG